MNNMELDYTAILLAVVSLIGAILTKVLVPYLQARLTEQKLSEIKFWVDIAVIAVEKAFEGEPDKGEIKKYQVMEFIQKLNLPITEEQLELLIDAVVEELINRPYFELME